MASAFQSSAFQASGFQAGLTIAERIVAITGLSGVSVNVHMLAFPSSSGGTIGTRIETRSSLGSDTVAAHLLDEGGGGGSPSGGQSILIWRRRRR